MIEYTTANSDEELRGILNLQTENLPRSLSENEIRSQGFVTVEHNFELLKSLHEIEPHVIGKSGNEVVGYVLSMTKKSRQDIPILLPMFRIFDEAMYKGRTVSESNYMVVGQVCVAKKFRGFGIFDSLYSTFFELHKAHYDFVITEIAQSNSRSLSAHQRVGFKELLSYTGPDGVEWVVVIRELKQ